MGGWGYFFYFYFLVHFVENSSLFKLEKSHVGSTDTILMSCVFFKQVCCLFVQNVCIQFWWYILFKKKLYNTSRNNGNSCFIWAILFEIICTCWTFLKKMKTFYEQYTLFSTLNRISSNIAEVELQM